MYAIRSYYVFKDSVFIHAFETAAIANYTAEERMVYEESLKTYRDLKGVIDTAFDEGKEEGLIEGILKEKHQVALKCIENGLSNRNNFV